jgi:hypothetical protein
MLQILSQNQWYVFCFSKNSFAVFRSDELALNPERVSFSELANIGLLVHLFGNQDQAPSKRCVS